MATPIEAKRICNGSFGEAWMDGEYLAEVSKAQAKLEFNKEEIKRTGTWAIDNKITGYKGTGSLTLHKIRTNTANKVSTMIKAKQDVRFELILKLEEPDAYGAERVAIHDASFDDLTLADWEAQTPGEVEIPFTFTDYEYMDQIDHKFGAGA